MREARAASCPWHPCVFRLRVRLPVGPGRLETRIAKGPAFLGVNYVEVKRMD